MRPIQPVPDLPFYWIFTFVGLLMASAVPSSAQRTVVQESGGGRKIELQYNAAEQVTEMRTLGADGQLLQKQTYEYPAGSYVPQTTSTSYWPNGKIHRITRDTYDNNANFTGEFIQVFDESGKQIAGHQLTHDPQTNVYHCADWNVSAQKYQTVDCPAGEESSGSPETVKKFTQDEVTQQLAHARQAVPQASKSRPAAVPPSQPAAGTNVKEAGVILPARTRPGERVSGSVVEDPSHYEGTPGIVVTRVALPFAPTGAASTLSGWTLEVSGQPPQPADGPITLTVPAKRGELVVLFREAANASNPISKAISLPRGPSPKAKTPTSYLAPAICLKGQPCVIQGAFSGDNSQTFAAFEDRPARIVAETADTAYIAIPERTEAGLRPLVIAEGPKAVAFPMVVAEFSLTPERRDLSKGQQLLLYPTIEGPEELPDSLWLPGNYPASNLEEARKLIPGFQVPRASREAKEKREAESKEKREAKEKPAAEKGERDEDQGGEILLVVKNLTPDQASFHESKNGTFIFHLKVASFKMGEFRYKFVAEAIKSGTFAVQSYVIPFLAPVTGQEFPMTPAPAK
ncbi:MAG: hypothetical protein ABSD98_13715 [Candidatus Korobacteraceae bacterium]|jgi:hypothetical protein